MGAQEISTDVLVCSGELQEENSKLRSEIAWRREEIILLRRSIGTGKVYSKLRENIRDTERENEALRKRVTALEVEKKSRQHFHVFNVSFFHKLLQRLIKKGDSLQHPSWAECRCGKCSDWQKAKEELSYHFGVMSGTLEDVDSGPALDRAASL